MATTYSKTRFEDINTNTATITTAEITTAEIETLVPENITVPNGTVKDPAGEASLGLGGSVTVANQLVQNDSIILVSALEPMIGNLHVENRTAGTSFDIVSSDSGDAGNKVAWLIINLA